MTQFLDPEQAANAARALQDERMDSVRELVHAQNHFHDLRAKAAEAEKQHATAWSAALSKGWTETELRRVGLAEPSGAGTPKRARRAGKTTSRD